MDFDLLRFMAAGALAAIAAAHVLGAPKGGAADLLYGALGAVAVACAARRRIVSP